MDYENETTCPGCESENGSEAFMGRLGRLDHFRCPACGIDYNRVAQDAEPAKGSWGDGCIENSDGSRQPKAI